MRSIAFALAAILVCAVPVLADDEPKKDEPKKEEPRKGDAAKKGPKDDAAIKKQLDEQKLTFNFDATPFTEVVQFLQDITGLNVVVDGAAKKVIDKAEPKVTLKEKNITLKDALDKALGQAKLSYEVWKGTVWVSTKEGLAAKPAAIKLDAELTKKLQQTVTFNFAETPLVEVVQFLQDFTHARFELAEKFDGDSVKVDLRLRSIPAVDVLAIIARVANVELTQKKDTIVIGPKAEKKK